MKKISTCNRFIKTYIIALALILLPFISISQNAIKGEALEKLWNDNETSWANDFKHAVKATQADFDQFLTYNQTTFYKDRGVFWREAEQGKLNNNTAIQFFAKLKKKYLPLYSQYLNVKANYPNTLAEYAPGHNGNNQGLHGNIMNNNCNPACSNIDCSNGTLSGWNAYYAIDQSTQFSMLTSAPVGGPCGAVTRAALDPNTNSYQVTLMSGSGVDPVCGGFIPVVPPMGNYSIRIGDSTGTNLGVGQITNSFVITGNNPVLTIQYAVVLENPPSHLGWIQPWFQMQVTDSIGNPISGCGQYTVVSTSGLPGFKPVWYPPGFDTVFCKSWTTVFVPLYNYVGHCVTVSFEVSDCGYGGHFGYAYVACSCSDLKLASSSPAFCGQTAITLTAPPGAASYTWSGPCISGPNNQQTCSVTCPGTYKVIIVSTAGPTCADTLSINIPSAPGPPPVPYFTTDTVCAGVPTLFTNLTNPLNGNKYYWDFYDNQHIEDSVNVNPLWTFPVGGVYHVHLKAVHNGCGEDTTLTVIVDSTYLPQMSVFSFCSGQPTNFDNISQGGGHYIWNFGDSHCPPNQDTSSLTFANHTYSQPGTYTVSLKVTNTRCPDSALQVITIDTTPVEHISMNPIRCGSDTVTFHADDSTNVYEYNWSFYNSNQNFIGSRFSVTSATTSFVFPSNNASYQIVLIAYSSNGFCPGYDTLNITLGVDTPHFSTRPPVVCLGRSITFHDSSSGNAIKWDWNFGDPGSGPSDSSNLQNPSHKFSAPGTYTVKFTTTSASNCVKDTTQTITVNPVAVANFKGDSVCFGDSTNFQDLSTMLGGGALSGWSWNFGDPPSGLSNTSIKQDPGHKFTVAGTYTVSLTALTAAGCDSTIKKTILVYPSPLVKYRVSKTCLGAVTQFTDGTVITGGGVLATWNWTFGDGGTSNVQSPSHTYATWGTYNTQLVVTSTNGCSDTTKEKIMVNPNPVVSFTADSLAGCAPLCLNFADHSNIAHGSDVKWKWNFGTPSDTGSGPTPNFCYQNYGAYSVTLDVTSDSGCKSTQTVNNMISVYGDPRAIFTPTPLTTDILDPIITFNNTSNPGQHDSIMYFTWTFSDDSVAYTKDVTRTFADTGTYCATLKVINGRGCVDSTTECVIVKPAFTFYIPDAFTPNGNGINDVFLPKGTYIRTYDIWIFDRWGTLVFHSNRLTTGWDGTSASHVLCQEDTYVYVITLTDALGKGHNYMGKVSLLK